MAGSVVGEKTITAIAEMVGIEPKKIQDNTSLHNLGVDSLMGMEVAQELELTSKCPLDMFSTMTLTEFSELVKFIRAAIGDDGKDGDEEFAAIEIEDAGDPSKSSSSAASSVDGSVMPETSSRSSLSSGAASPPKPQSNITARQIAINLFVAKYSKVLLLRCSG
jgi:acyl carrier protein